MILREFLKLYNFRYFHNEKENTQTVRIYLEWPKDWFEFGVNDFQLYNESRDDLVEKIIHKDILDRQVSSVYYDDSNDVFCIVLDEPEDAKTPNS